jgi:hypothetical protein
VLLVDEHVIVVAQMQRIMNNLLDALNYSFDALTTAVDSLQSELPSAHHDDHTKHYELQKMPRDLAEEKEQNPVAHSHLCSLTFCCLELQKAAPEHLLVVADSSSIARAPIRCRHSSPAPRLGGRDLRLCADRSRRLHLSLFSTSNQQLGLTRQLRRCKSIIIIIVVGRRD